MGSQGVYPTHFCENLGGRGVREALLVVIITEVVTSHNPGAGCCLPTRRGPIRMLCDVLSVTWGR